MYKNRLDVFYHVKSSLHVGTGDVLGLVDLPIQREKHTSFPKIESSSLKGAIRNHFESVLKEDKKTVDDLFGPEDADQENAKMGLVAFTDAKILLFPVKSIKGVFALITCPFILKRYYEDTEENIPDFLKGMNVEDGKFISFVNNSEIIINNDKVVLEEFTFVKSSQNIDLSKIKLNSVKSDKILILSDNDFKYFVNNSTEVITRIKINNETGTVDKGALFNEEFLPAESVLYNQLYCDEKDIKGKSLKDFMKEKMNSVMQIGGDETIGKGIVKVIC
ncbi:MAG: type III-B CRISPR module RAMP protein Cmr4 [candidate division WOR-3 bacterium]